MQHRITIDGRNGSFEAYATVNSYPGQRHANSRHNGAHYNAAAAALASKKTTMSTTFGSMISGRIRALSKTDMIKFLQHHL